MSIHHRMENALARAEELIAVGNKGAALHVLHDTVLLRWLPHNLGTLDAIMERFLRLCVELRKGRIAKDGMHHYRNTCQATNTAGIEKMVLLFVDAAEECLYSSEEIDRRAEDSSEHTMPSDYGLKFWELNCESNFKPEPKVELAQSMRFVWETYRVVIDMCRHNARLESTYSQLVKKAISFCHQNKRRGEFRRLCDMLRYHLSIMIKFPDQANGIHLSEKQSHQLQLELRFQILDIAVENRQWTEAFRALEDIHSLFVLARRSASPPLVRVYYERLGRLFLQSGDYIMLGAALSKLLILSSNPSSDELSPESKKILDMAIVSMLAAPLVPRDQPQNMSLEEAETRSNRLAYFVGLSRAPTTASLSQELLANERLPLASPAVQELHNHLTKNLNESDFYAIVTEKIRPILLDGPLSALTTADIDSLLESLLRNAALLSISRLSPVVAISDVTKIVSSIYGKPNIDCSVETKILLADGIRGGAFTLKIDELGKKIEFLRPAFSPRPVLVIENAQNSPSNMLYRRLLAVVNLLSKPEKPINLLDQAVSHAMKNLSVEHKNNLARKALIERRKEQLEEMHQRREREEARERTAKQRAEQEAEAKRLAEESARRENLRREAEKEEIRRELNRKREEDEQRRKENAALRESLEKTIAIVRRIDHMERAYRAAEVELLEQDYQCQKAADETAHNLRELSRIDQIKRQHSTDLAAKAAVEQIVHDRKSYLEKYIEPIIIKNRQEALKAFETACEARRAETISHKRASILAENEATKKAAIQKAAEEMAVAEKARKDAEYAEKMRELDMIAEKQRQKRAEVEARLQTEVPTKKFVGIENLSTAKITSNTDTVNIESNPTTDPIKTHEKYVSPVFRESRNKAEVENTISASRNLNRDHASVSKPPDQPATTTTSKYIPPSLRKALDEGSVNGSFEASKVINSNKKNSSNASFVVSTQDQQTSTGKYVPPISNLQNK